MLATTKWEIDSNRIIVGDFTTPLTPMNRSSGQKINKETQALNHTLDQKDLMSYSGHSIPKQICFFFNFTDYFVWYEYCNLCFLLMSICMGIFPITLLLVFICPEVWSGCFVDSIYTGLVSVSIQPVCFFQLGHLSIYI